MPSIHAGSRVLMRKDRVHFHSGRRNQVHSSKTALNTSTLAIQASQSASSDTAPQVASMERSLQVAHASSIQEPIPLIRNSDASRSAGRKGLPEEKTNNGHASSSRGHNGFQTPIESTSNAEKPILPPTWQLQATLATKWLEFGGEVDALIAKSKELEENLVNEIEEKTRFEAENKLKDELIAQKEKQVDRLKETIKELEEKQKETEEEYEKKIEALEHTILEMVQAQKSLQDELTAVYEREGVLNRTNLPAIKNGHSMSILKSSNVKRRYEIEEEREEPKAKVAPKKIRPSTPLKKSPSVNKLSSRSRSDTCNSNSDSLSIITKNSGEENGGAGSSSDDQTNEATDEDESHEDETSSQASRIRKPVKPVDEAEEKAKLEFVDRVRVLSLRELFPGTISLNEYKARVTEMWGRRHDQDGNTVAHYCKGIDHKCNWSFKAQRRARAGIERHYNRVCGAKFLCPECDAQVTRADTLLRHYSTSHLNLKNRRVTI